MLLCYFFLLHADVCLFYASQVVKENFNALLAANPDVDRSSIKHPYLKTEDSTVHLVDDEEEDADAGEEKDQSPKHARVKNRRAAAVRKKTTPKKTPVREIANRRKTPDPPVVEDEFILKTASPTVTSPSVANSLSQSVRLPLQQSRVAEHSEVKSVTPDLAVSDTVATTKSDGMFTKLCLNINSSNTYIFNYCLFTDLIHALHVIRSFKSDERNFKD